MRTKMVHTAQGGTRLLEYSKALRKFRNSQKIKKNKDSKNDDNNLHLVFDLPDFVSRENIIAYSYCFEQKVDPNNAADRSLQYTIAYFEFEVKGEETPNDKFNQMSKINFSDVGGGNGQQGNNNSNGPNTNSQSSSTTGTGHGTASGSRINNLVVSVTLVLLA